MCFLPFNTIPSLTLAQCALSGAIAFFFHLIISLVMYRFVMPTPSEVRLALRRIANY